MATIKYKDTGGVWQTAGTPTSLYTYSYDGTNKIHILTGSGTFGQVEFLTQYVSSTDTITVNGTTISGIYLGGLAIQTLRPSFYSFVYDGSNLYFQTSAIYNSLDQTSSGFALDARQGKTLNDAITTRGVPAEGTTGQVLVKASATDYDTEWAAVGRANLNLLHNWDWRTPVNQRAATGAVSNAYCIDRWIGNGTVTPSSGNYITLANGTTMIQRLEVRPAKLYSMAHTVSIDIAGTIQSATLTFPSSGAGSAVSQALTGVTVEIGFVDLGSGNTSSLEGVLSQYIPYVKYTATAAINVARVKLELGNVSTLAYTSSTSFGETQTLCRRYYNKIDIAGVVQTKTTTNVYLISTTNFPAPMRIPPSVSGGLSQTFSGAIPNVTTFTATIAQMYVSVYRPEEWRLTLSADVGSVGSFGVLYSVLFTSDL